MLKPRQGSLKQGKWSTNTTDKHSKMRSGQCLQTLTSDLIQRSEDEKVKKKTKTKKHWSEKIGTGNAQYSFKEAGVILTIIYIKYCHAQSSFPRLFIWGPKNIIQCLNWLRNFRDHGSSCLFCKWGKKPREVKWNLFLMEFLCNFLLHELY